MISSNPSSEANPRYQITSKIGKGSFGKVYLATDPINNREVAIKVVSIKSIGNKKGLEHMQNEILILQKCDSPHIVKLYEYNKTSEYIYLVLEYCNEKDMSQYLAKRGRLDETEAIEFLRQLVEAFKVLSKHNIIHRDLKLENILKHDKIIKIGDFGLSKLLDCENMATSSVGTPLNRAPETFLAASYTNKVDVWALGIVFYQFLYGKHPFAASNRFELAEKQKKGVEFPQDIPISSKSKELIRRMLEQDPYKRASWEEIFKCVLEDDPVPISKTLTLKVLMAKSSLSTTSAMAIGSMIKEVETPNTAMMEKELGLEAELTFENIDEKVREIMNISDAGQLQGVGNIFISHLDEKEIIQEDDWTVVTKTENLSEKRYNAIKQAITVILSERNKNVRLAYVAEDVNLKKRDLSVYVSYIFAKEAYEGLKSLYDMLKDQTNASSIENWDTFLNSKIYDDLKVILRYELDVLEEKYRFKERALKKLKKFDPRLAYQMISVINENSLEDKNAIKGLYVKEIQSDIERSQGDKGELWNHLGLIAQIQPEIADSLKEGTTSPDRIEFFDYALP